MLMDAENEDLDVQLAHIPSVPNTDVVINEPEPAAEEDDAFAALGAQMGL